MRDEIANLDAAVRRVLESGQYILGPELVELEIELGRYVGSPNPGIGVANGTDAIALALAAIGLQSGDEVLTCSFAPVPVITGILMAGATPVLADVDVSNATISLDSLEQKLSASTRAVLAVHLYGNQADIDGIEGLVRGRGIHIVEDISQAFGSRFEDGSRLGSRGAVSALSMYPTKNLAALGDAGAVFAKEEEWANDLRSRRQYGWDVNRVSQFRGQNSRLDELQAAILRERLACVEDARVQRLEDFEIIRMFVEELKLGRIITNGSDRFFPHLFVIEVPNRKTAIHQLESMGIESAIHYERALHQHPAFGEFGSPGLANSEQLANSVLTIPWAMSSRIKALMASGVLQ